MSELDFETGDPIWQVIFYHSGPDGVWGDTVNAESEAAAINMCRRKAEREGINPVTIFRVETQEFNVPKEE